MKSDRFVKRIDPKKKEMLETIAQKLRRTLASLYDEAEDMIIEKYKKELGE